jgi:hypothetical protein
MAKQGHLNLKNAQYSMPADAAAYQSPPFYYRNTRSISVAFETDTEAALQALPAPLAISEPATAVLSFYEYPWTTFGPYNEAILSLLVEHKGRPMSYIMHIAVTTEPPMLAGREIWGFPKKLAQIEFKSEKDMVYGTLETSGGSSPRQRNRSTGTPRQQRTFLSAACGKLPADSFRGGKRASRMRRYHRDSHRGQSARGLDRHRLDRVRGKFAP